MPSPSNRTELQDFVQFATLRIERGGGDESVENLVRQWRNELEFAQTVADVRQGIVDDKEGRAEPLRAAISDIRRQLETGK